MDQPREEFSIWFFIGLILTLYGALITAAGIVQWHHPAPVALARLDAPLWWGILLLVVGLIYVWRFRSGRGRGL